MAKKAKKASFKFDLGDSVKCNITGFEGIVYCRTQWLYNCNTYSIKPMSLNKDGKPNESEHLDEPALKIMKKKTMKEDRKTGGPTDPVMQTNR